MATKREQLREAIADVQEAIEMLEERLTAPTFAEALVIFQNHRPRRLTDEEVRGAFQGVEGEAYIAELKSTEERLTGCTAMLLDIRGNDVYLEAFNGNAETLFMWNGKLEETK